MGIQIKRIQVEEGFLSGLDLRLSPGLNVLIGPRGTGKTSVIELVRFCLDAASFTDRAASRGLEHARAVLGSGEVTLTFDVDGQEYVVSRTADGSTGTSHSRPIPVTVLSQNEIEWIGLDAVGRLRLIDAFRTDKEVARTRAAALRSQARSLTVEGRSLWQKIEAVEEQRAMLIRDATDLQYLEQQQHSTLAALEEATPKQAELDSLSRDIAQLSVRSALLERTDDSLSKWEVQVQAAIGSPARLESWPEPAGPQDLLESVRRRLEGARTLLGDASEQIQAARSEVAAVLDANAQARIAAEARARGLRTELESLREGTGKLARRVAELREKIGQAEALEALSAQLMEQRQELLARRDALLDELDSVCRAEYEQRAAVADALNRELGPRIHVDVERSGLPVAYVDALRAALRGSGLKYNQLASQVAERLSPRELTSAVEQQNAQAVAEIAEISLERASRLIAEVASRGAEDVVTCELQDTVTLSLLDGIEYKTTERLSTGQRCTVVLPLLLSHREDLLVIDQPEDHLDNAFIVETVVQAIQHRSRTAQLLISTHNPNIPVLGNATTVVLMGSDGRRGFVRHTGPLDASASIQAITTVMEGGLEAFKRRSLFYGASAS